MRWIIRNTFLLGMTTYFFPRMRSPILLDFAGGSPGAARWAGMRHPPGSPWPQGSASCGPPQWGGHQQQPEGLWLPMWASPQYSPLHLLPLGLCYHWRTAGGTLPILWYHHSPFVGCQNPQPVPWIQLCHASDFTGHDTAQGGQWRVQETDFYHNCTRYHHYLIHHQTWPRDRHSPARFGAQGLSQIKACETKFLLIFNLSCLYKEKGQFKGVGATRSEP